MTLRRDLPGLSATVTSYIGLGSNMDEPERQLQRALAALGAVPDARLGPCSSFYRSAPVGPGGQPDYVNAVARLRSAMTARALLERLLLIERQHGRVRGGPRWGPRILDLDLLLHGDRVVDEDGLTVPHPEIRHRNFVLVPLLEIDPDIEIPGLGRADQLLPDSGAGAITRLGPARLSH